MLVEKFKFSQCYGMRACKQERVLHLLFFQNVPGDTFIQGLHLIGILDYCNKDTYLGSQRLSIIYVILCSFQIILRINNRKNWLSTNTNGELFNHGKGLGRACMLGRACKRVQACRQEQVLRIRCIEHQQHIRCIHQQCKLRFGYGRQGGERSIFHWLQRHLCKWEFLKLIKYLKIKSLSWSLEMVSANSLSKILN